ncbi:MAG: AAA family ATPase, partial [Gemmatimonadota bacterium]
MSRTSSVAIDGMILALAASKENVAAHLREPVALRRSLTPEQVAQLLDPQILQETETLETQYRSAASRQPGEAPIPIKTLAEILADPLALEPPRAVVPGIAWSERTTFLAAREKTGKSTFVMAIAAAVSSGSPFLSRPTEAGTALVVTLDEHLGDTARRIVRFGADPERVLLTDRLAGQDPLENLTAIVRQYRPKLLVIDSLANLAALAGIDDASSSAKMTPLMTRLVSIARDAGPAMILIGHGRKSDGGYRDSSAIGASVDAIIEMHEGADASERELRAKARWPVENLTIRLCGNLH